MPTRRAMKLRRLYGGNPLQLLVFIGCFALTGYAVDKVRLDVVDRERILVWFVAAFVGHDLVLYPVYALADRSLQVFTSLVPRRRAARRGSVVAHAAAVNAIRIPAALSLLLLLIFQGPIRHQGDQFFFNASDHHEVNYFLRWLLTVAALFLGSALFYAWRSGLRHRASRQTGRAVNS